MYPLIVPGRDEAWITSVEPETVRRGDVVLYRRDNGMLVLHRIWKKKGDSFYLVGDNQKEIEGPLSKEQIKGIMYAVNRKGKIIKVTNLVYRMYSFCWLFLRPVRPQISKVLHRCKVIVFSKERE